MSFGWMAWTPATAGLFVFIAACLLVMSVVALRWRETPRRGLLRFPTTRGDRLFLSLIGTAWVFVAWIRLGGGEVLWWPLLIAAALWAVLFRYA